MNLYPHDCSYLNTEYGRRKSQECYDLESREKEKVFDDGEQEGNEYKNVADCINKGGVKMAKRYGVEFDETIEGLRCVGILTFLGHRCGYVGVDKTHPFYNLNYYDQIPKEFLYLYEETKEKPIGKGGIINLYCLDSDNPEIGLLFDVHGGITFSGSSEKGYPVETQEPLWFFGFDCNHYGDDEDPKSKEYVRNECKGLAKQLSAAGCPRSSVWQSAEEADAHEPG